MHVSKAFLCTMQSYRQSQQTQKKNINYFHRKLLRKMLNIKCPKGITNEDLYSKTKEKPWSNIIARLWVTTRKHAHKNGTN